jgi:hypothetical protein
MVCGVYETVYGNACEYYEGDDFAFDMDMGEEIPVDMVDFSKFIRDID